MAYFFMSFVSGCIAALDWVDEVVEPLSEQADRVTTAKQTRQTNMRCFIASDYARGMPNVKWEELPLDYARERHASARKTAWDTTRCVASCGYSGPDCASRCSRGLTRWSAMSSE
jgi:hypothetical protein